MHHARPRAAGLQRPRALRAPAPRFLSRWPAAGGFWLALIASAAILRAAPLSAQEAAAPAQAASQKQPAKSQQGSADGGFVDPLEREIPNSSESGAKTGGPLFTLRDLVERARKADPRARQSYAQVEHAQGKRDETSWAWFPTFDTQVGGGGPTTEARLRGGDADPNLNDLTPGTLNGGWSNLGFAVRSSISAILPLYTFGKISSGNDAAAHALRAQEALLARTRDQTTFDVTRAYWGYQTTHFGLAAIEGVRRQIADARKRAQEMLDDGSDQLTRADLTRLDYVAEEVEAQHAGSVKNEALSMTSIKLLIGLTPEDPINIARQQLPQPPAQPAFDAMVKLGLERRPEARAALENVAARIALVELERARYFPDLGLVGFYSWNYQSNASSPISPFVNNPNSHGGYIALGLRATFDVPQKFYRVRQAESDLHEAQALLAGAESLLRLDLQTALGDLAEARVRAQRYTKEATIGKALLVQAALAFDSGLGSAQDLVIDTYLYSRAIGEQLRALMDVQIAWAALEKAVGTEVQQVPLPVQAPQLPGPAPK